MRYQKLPAQFARDLHIPTSRVYRFEDANHFVAEDNAPEFAEQQVRFALETSETPWRGYPER